MSDKGKSYLTLKWGTLKSWDFNGCKKGIKLLKEYFKIGVSASAACQHNTPRQNEIVCELIDLCYSDTIFLDWDGTKVSKEKAKEYVMTYGR